VNDAVGSIVTIATAIVGVALLAVLVSKNAQTPQVVQAFGNAFTGAIGAAVSPVTGGSGLGNFGSSVSLPNI
jgi:PRD1 phage membrane DNA delivery